MKTKFLILSIGLIFLSSCKNEEGTSKDKNKSNPPKIEEDFAFAEEIKPEDYKLLYYEKAAPNVNIPKIYDSVSGVTTSFSSVKNQMVSKRGLFFDGDIFVTNGYGITRFNSANNISAVLKLNPEKFYSRGIFNLSGSLYTIVSNTKLEKKFIKWNTNLNVVDTVIDFPNISNGEVHTCTYGNITYITNGEFFSFNHTTHVFTKLSSTVGFNRYNKMLCLTDSMVLSNQYRPTKYAVYGYESQLETYDINTGILTIEFNSHEGPIQNLQRMNEKVFFTYLENGYYKLNIYDLITKTRVDLSVGQFDQFLIHSLSMNGRLAVYTLADNNQNTIYMYYDMVDGTTGNLSTLGTGPTPNTYMFDVFNGDDISWFITQRQDVYQRPDLVHIEDNVTTVINPSNFPQDNDGNYLEVKFIGVGYGDLITTYQGLIHTVDKNGIFTEIANTNDSPAYSELFYY